MRTVNLVILGMDQKSWGVMWRVLNTRTSNYLTTLNANSHSLLSIRVDFLQRIEFYLKFSENTSAIHPKYAIIRLPATSVQIINFKHNVHSYSVTPVRNAALIFIRNRSKFNNRFNIIRSCFMQIRVSQMKIKAHQEFLQS